MRQIASLVCGFLLACQAQASAVFDGSGDYLAGTFTSNYADPLTIGVKIKVANHPAASQVIVHLGNANNSANDSYMCRFSVTDNNQTAVSTNAGGTTQAAVAAGFVDDTWISVVCRFIADNSRAVRTEATSATNGSTNAVADVIHYIRLGRNFNNGNDFSGRIAEVAVWDVDLGTTDQDAYVANNCTSLIDPTNLIAYYPLIDDADDFANDGLDTAGDLTATGNAAIDADHPTMGSCAQQLQHHRKRWE